MIGRLYIKNFFLIREAEIIFGEGLNVITGETGTGKSMTISALSFLMGAPGNYPEGTAVEVELLGDEEVILRREVKKGRSRYFLNGRGTTKSVVSEILKSRVSIQGQNDFINLLRSDFHRKVLDTYANLDLKELEESYILWKKKEKELEEFLKKREEFIKNRDYLEFRIKELEEVGITPEEYEELKEKEKNIRASQKIAEALSKSIGLLYEGENSVYTNLGHILKEISRLSSISEDFRKLEGRIEKLSEDVYEIYSHLLDKFPNFDEFELETINEKLYRAQRLEEKYRKPFTQIYQEVEKMKEELKDMDLDSLEEKLKKETEVLREKYFRIARKVSRIRREKAKELENELEKILKELNLRDAKLRFSIEETTPSRHGIDKVELLFSSYGKDVRPVGETASGGELSRLFLALSTVLPVSETYVFDEIDTGISGETSLKVAKFLKDLSRKMQVIVITHSAPLCAAGDHNYRTEKRVLNGKAEVEIRELSEKEKIEEVARLMGIRSEKTIEGAKELLKLFKENGINYLGWEKARK
ncbi:DNA repair protein RecN [Aquifex pyrophilus]